MEKYCTAEQATDDNTIRRIAFWILKATNIISEYVKLMAFPLQQWLHERIPMLRYSALPVLVKSQISKHYIRSQVSVISIVTSDDR